MRLLIILFALLVAPAASIAQAADGSQYVASTRGRVYYWIGCNAWRQLSPANLRYFRSAADAERAGYTPSRSRGCAPQGTQVTTGGNEQSAVTPIKALPGGSATCQVSRVVDGDTFECAAGQRVRLLLIDTPELASGKPRPRCCRSAPWFDWNSTSNSMTAMAGCWRMPTTARG